MARKYSLGQTTERSIKTKHTEGTDQLVVYRVNVISEVSDYSTNSNVVRTWLHDDFHARTAHMQVSLVFGALQRQPRWERHPLATSFLLVLSEYELRHPG
jgi:hypothetical protein